MIAVVDVAVVVVTLNPLAISILMNKIENEEKVDLVD